MASSTALPPTHGSLSARPGVSRSASVIVTSRRPSLRRAAGSSDGTAARGEEGGLGGGGRGRTAARPITWALPSPSPAAQEKSPHLSSSLTHPSTSPTSFLNRISRKLSQSRTTLVRRVSKSGARNSPTASKPQSVSGGAAGEDKENRSPSPSPAVGGSHAREPSQTPSSLSALAARVEQLQMPSPEKNFSKRMSLPAAPRSSSPALPSPPLASKSAVAGAAGLKRMRPTMTVRRTKSEAKRKGRIPNEEEKMRDLVRRTAEGEGAGQEEEGGKEGRKSPPAEDWTEVRSNLGSYFWSESLGVCWDGREKVHPDFLFSFQPYSSNSDVLPPHHSPRDQLDRVVYASTLSSFPPRPPLRPRTPELTPASKIIAEYRALHGTLTPSVKGEDGLEEEEQWSRSEEETPRPGEDHLAATPVDREAPSLATLETPTKDLNLSGSTLTARPALAVSVPPFSSSNPFRDSSPSSSTKPTFSLLPPRPLSQSLSSPSAGSSAYSTPTSEPAQFQFAFEDPDPVSPGGVGESEGDEAGGARMSSESSATSLESLAAMRVVRERERKGSAVTRITEGEEEWKECE
ncbi:hypothetical protein JCM8547_006416 [Rhodosporidiobolus lusitaniae]